MTKPLAEIVREIDALYSLATQGEWAGGETATLNGPEIIHTSPSGEAICYRENIAIFVGHRNGRLHAKLCAALVNAWPTIRAALEARGERGCGWTTASPDPESEPITNCEALRLQLEAREWQPIETAPKDGRKIILGYTGCWAEEGYWMGDSSRSHWKETGWYSTDDDVLCCHPSTPTHWMPLPQPPKERV